VTLSHNADGRVIADAVQFLPVDALPNRATPDRFRGRFWAPDLPQAANYDVYGWWITDAASNTNAAQFTVYHDGGSTTIVKSQDNGEHWEPLGTFALTPGQNHRVMLTDQTTDTSGDRVVADAIRLTRVGAPPPTATWTPTLPLRDEYDVYARWVDYPTRATNAPYTIFHEGGSTTATKNQKQNGGTWQLLGSFVMAPGQGHRVELTDVADGEVVADAVKFVPKNAGKAATWAFSVGATGAYKVYAKWPALPGTGATDAPFTVTHAGGTTVVTANQRVNGGKWNLLGSFAFNTGTTYKVELSDQASGKVAADAIYYIADGMPTDQFTWTPTFPSAGSYQVFARWPANSNNTGAANYTITHTGGTAGVTANQKQNGGAWVPLGSWSFAPASGHKVTLNGSADGATIADALLFVAAGSQPANVLYVHADHLGSPQKLTDTAQATAWDGMFDPFAEEVVISGLAAMPMRFPGQYADDETGFSYNYFRDYEPTLGRYLESDPIGLRGGINSYLYVAANPLRAVDEIGLDTTVIITPYSGIHTGLHIDNDGNPILWDPSGSYCAPQAERCEDRGSGGWYSGRAANVEDYLRWMASEGDEVKVYQFLTTPEEEAEIAQRIFEIGDPRGFYCALAVGEALRGIGPFENLQCGCWFPSNLARELEEIYRQQVIRQYQRRAVQ
jgi:RHS repeat-associated protein